MFLKNLRALPVVLIFMGLVVCVMNAQRYMALEDWSDEEIRRNVELNYTLDLWRMASQNGGEVPQQTEEEREIHLAAIHNEIVSADRTARTEIRNEFIVGVALTIGGLVLFFLARNAQMRTPPGSLPKN